MTEQSLQMQVANTRLCNAWAGSRWQGLFQLWLCVSREFFEITLPQQVSVAAVPVSAFLIATALLYGYCVVFLGQLAYRPYCP